YASAVAERRLPARDQAANDSAQPPLTDRFARSAHARRALVGVRLRTWPRARVPGRGEHLRARRAQRASRVSLHDPAGRTDAGPIMCFTSASAGARHHALDAATAPGDTARPLRDTGAGDRHLRAARALESRQRGNPARRLNLACRGYTVIDMEPLPRNECRLHGHTVSYRMGGEGPALVLVHGITSSSETWNAVAPVLAKRFTVLAPDLLGHGLSAKPRGDYSMGAYASGLRDLLVAVGIDRATVVGHSLGGGIAMQFAYQFPERCERLVLVSSGGLGRTVHILLRAATLPGSELVLPLLTATRLLDAGRWAGGLLSRMGLRVSTDALEMARGHASLADPDAR